MKIKRNPFQIVSACILSCVVISSGMLAVNAAPDDEDSDTVTEYSESASSGYSDTEDSGETDTESYEESSAYYEESSEYEDSSYYEESSEAWSEPESDTWTPDYNDDTDDGEFSYIDEYDYENTSSEEETTEESSSGSEGSGEEESSRASKVPKEHSVDTSEMTSKDWKDVQENMTSSDGGSSSGGESKSSKVLPLSQGQNSGGSEFDDLKDAAEGGNDAWIFLAVGIPLIVLGAGLIALVIYINIKKPGDKKNDPGNRNDKGKKRNNKKGNRSSGRSGAEQPPRRAAEGSAGKEQGRYAQVSPDGKDKKLPRDLVDTLDKPLDFTDINDKS